MGLIIYEHIVYLGNIATAATYESMTTVDRDLATQEPSMKRGVDLKSWQKLLHVLRMITFLLPQVIP
ncbi:hypothetical protein NMY3_01301 [Candidatus Nitrosocosmicus oleophilus]|uniref:Uncharacterized protein n=1 Tax=Candidatus Nitrosocosmicus oleophilus TaxID=1353260 RepID=A0A654LWB9_9ARCH|nr:hypothetical protein [Candidatus Nitrosocosmicus oleophilus]ALI35505.1 hypothetical protein NMY3_01301 [Candidatus Nitrosocosmicus oleophilus]